MGRAAKHNWRKLFLEYNQGRYKNVADFAKKKGINPNQVRDEFRKLKNDQGRESAETTENNREKQQKTTEKKGAKKRITENPHPWQKLKQQFTGWPEEKLQAYLLQLNARKTELEAVPIEELSSEEIRELGQIRRERRAILSDPDPDKKCSAHNKDGSPCRNPAERGKSKCWNHGGAPGSGCPPGLKNALKTGEYETIWMDALEEDERALVEQVLTDPIQQVNEEIRLLAVRERRMLKRIQDMKSGLTEKQRRVLQERKLVKEAIPVYDEKSGQMKIVTRLSDELVVTEIEEKEYRVIDDILRIEEALTRVQDKKLKAIEVKHKIETTGTSEDDGTLDDLARAIEESRRVIENGHSDDDSGSEEV